MSVEDGRAESTAETVAQAGAQERPAARLPLPPDSDQKGELSPHDYNVGADYAPERLAIPQEDLEQARMAILQDARPGGQKYVKLLTLERESDASNLEGLTVPGRWNPRGWGSEPKLNEDAIAGAGYPDGFAWGMVLDGMGGYLGGVAASGTCKAEVAREISEMPNSCRRDPDLLYGAIFRGISKAQGEVQKKFSQAGSALAFACVISEGDKQILHYLRAADSRVYLVRKDGIIEQLTEDQTRVQVLVNEGRLTPAQAKIHPDNNVVTGDAWKLSPPAWGTRALEKREVTEGDTVIITSGGVSDEFFDVDPKAPGSAWDLQANAGFRPNVSAQEILARTLARQQQGLRGLSKPESRDADKSVIVMRIGAGLSQAERQRKEVESLLTPSGFDAARDQNTALRHMDWRRSSSMSQGRMSEAGKQALQDFRTEQERVHHLFIELQSLTEKDPQSPDRLRLAQEIQAGMNGLESKLKEASMTEESSQLERCLEILRVDPEKIRTLPGELYSKLDGQLSLFAITALTQQERDVATSLAQDLAQLKRAKSIEASSARPKTIERHVLAESLQGMLEAAIASRGALQRLECKLAKGLEGEPILKIEGNAKFGNRNVFFDTTLFFDTPQRGSISLPPDDSMVVKAGMLASGTEKAFQALLAELPSTLLHAFKMEKAYGNDRNVDHFELRESALEISFKSLQLDDLKPGSKQIKEVANKIDNLRSMLKSRQMEIGRQLTELRQKGVLRGMEETKERPADLKAARGFLETLNPLILQEPGGVEKILIAFDGLEALRGQLPVALQKEVDVAIRTLDQYLKD